MNQKEYINALERYVEYVLNYPEEHEIVGNYPVSFNEWRNNEAVEED